MRELNSIKDIEQHFNVEKVRYKNLSIWPILRYYICVKHSSDKSPVKPRLTSSLSLIRSFFYGFKFYFSKCDYLFISSSDQRKNIEGLMIDKSIDKIAENLKKTWILELPTNGHFPKSKIINKKVSSKLPLLVLTRLYAKLFLKRGILENKKVIDKIVNNLKIEFDAESLSKRHFAEYHVMKRMAKRKKIKAAFVVCHYTNMGYIKALRDLNIPVIEIQHGIISRSHCAYNLYSDSDTSFYPDYLLTYGEREKNISKDGNRFIQEQNIIPVGHAYLEYLAAEYKGDERLKSIVAEYSNSVAIVSQNHPVEEKLIDFVRKCADENSETLFVFIPRTFDKPESYYKFPTNIILYPDLNVYETVWHVDIHSTVFSTLALEAPAMGKPNVLINIDNLSKQYLGEFLNENRINSFVDNVKDFSQKMKDMIKLSKGEVIDLYGPIIKPGYDDNMEKFLNEYIKQN